MSQARVIQFEQHGDPSVLQLREIDVPGPPEGHVRIRVEAVGLNRAEINFRSGSGATPRFPSSIGYEASGLIDAVGEGVEGFQCGDRVAVLPGLDMEAYGTYAELLNYPADMVARMPSALSFVDAAATWMQYLTAYALIEPARVRTGDHVLITAASSSVGLAAIQIVNLIGAIPIALTSRPEKAEVLKRHGAAHVFVTNDENWRAAIVALCEGQGPRIVFDAVGEKMAPALVDVVRTGGVVVIYGALSGGNLSIAIPAAVRKELTVHFFSSRSVLRKSDQKREAMAFVLDGLQSAQLSPVVDRTFAFAEAAAAHRYLESDQGVGKVVLTMR